MLLKVLAMTSLLLGITACDTVYQPLQWDGGYQDKKLAANHYWIEYLGNTTTSITWITKHWHKRAHELCQNNYRTINMISTLADIPSKKPILETPLHRINPKLEGEIICAK